MLDEASRTKTTSALVPDPQAENKNNYHEKKEKVHKRRFLEITLSVFVLDEEKITDA